LTYRVQNGVEIDRSRLYIVTAAIAMAVYHVLQHSFSSSSGTGFAALGECVDDSIVRKSAK
jgi:hypothetical protein